jgi:chromosome condensin MukBEF ATPase and DNA-binding subunit MukB
MDDKQILHEINDMVAEEHDLRHRVQQGEIKTDEEHARLRELEVNLDRCWDLLRQRRAAKEMGTNPGDAHVRPAGEVEGYLQ